MQCKIYFLNYREIKLYTQSLDLKKEGGTNGKMDGWKLGKWLVIEVCFSSKNARQKQEKNLLRVIKKQDLLVLA